MTPGGGLGTSDGSAALQNMGRFVDKHGAS